MFNFYSIFIINFKYKLSNLIKINKNTFHFIQIIVLTKILYQKNGKNINSKIDK